MSENQNLSIRQSPLQAIIGETTFPSLEVQNEWATCLGLADTSLLEKWGLRGSGAADWLATMGVAAPAEVYATRPLSEGGLIARIGKEEFFLEAATCSQSFGSLRDALSTGSGCTAVVREDASFLVTGSRSLDLFAQTCSHRFATSRVDEWVYTRVAGVNCGILPQSQGDQTRYRLWFDPSYAVYLGETLLGIATELGGGAVRNSL
jgi:sarcosine oxidase subunit gamma